MPGRGLAGSRQLCAHSTKAELKKPPFSRTGSNQIRESAARHQRSTLRPCPFANLRLCENLVRRLSLSSFVPCPAHTPPIKRASSHVACMGLLGMTVVRITALACASKYTANTADHHLERTNQQSCLQLRSLPCSPLALSRGYRSDRL